MSKGELYRDILNDGGPAEFEQAVFRETVRTARRMRRRRIVGRSAAIGVIALIACLAAFQFRSPLPVEVVTAPATPKVSVLSHTVLRTQPFTGTIRSQRSEGILITAPQNAALLRTTVDHSEVRLINDEELLSFFEGKAVALLHHGPHDAELVFLDAEPRE